MFLHKGVINDAGELDIERVDLESIPDEKTRTILSEWLMFLGKGKIVSRVVCVGDTFYVMELNERMAHHTIQLNTPERFRIVSKVSE